MTTENINKPLDLLDISNKFGVTPRSLGNLYRQSSAVTLKPVYDSFPGAVGFTSRDSAGSYLVSSGAIDMEQFENCYYVVGSVRARVSNLDFSSASALLSTFIVDQQYGFVEYSGSGEYRFIESSYGDPAYGANSRSQLTVETRQSTVGTSTRYLFYRWKFVIITGWGDAGSHRFKYVNSTDTSFNSTDSYSGWQDTSTNVYSDGVVSGDYVYCVIFVRNRLDVV